MSNTLAAEKSSLALLERKDRELDGKLQMMAVVEQNLGSCSRLLDDSHAEFKRFDASRQQVLIATDAVEKRQMEIKDLVIREQVC